MLAYISPISRLYLAYISPISRLYLPYISPISRLYLACISPGACKTVMITNVSPASDQFEETLNSNPNP